ncbi:hypothetical protein MRB53_018084 [Persea americana]|uniref:Uncharacterized protein n=1 Tax=Persea americana TaxID=3435 RepID=A0ACC2M6V7_PERAE|nr:hypothetical protein MRB53_018084 [Persea americana]
MNGRVFVLIFFFWALLAIITPTLVLWSASAKPSLGTIDERTIDIKVKRMMSYIEKSYSRRVLRPQSPVAEAPAPAPSPDTGL